MGADDLRWKLQRAARPEKVWLFNLADDPTEQRDVAVDHPDRVAERCSRCWMRIMRNRENPYGQPS